MSKLGKLEPIFKKKVAKNEEQGSQNLLSIPQYLEDKPDPKTKVTKNKNKVENQREDLWKDSSELVGLRSSHSNIKKKSHIKVTPADLRSSSKNIPNSEGEDDLNRSRLSNAGKKGSPSMNNSFISMKPTESTYKKRRRVILAILAVVKFWRILEHIKQYGTSSNLYNIAFRSRKSVKKSIFPIAKGSSQVKIKAKLVFLFHPNSTFLLFWNILLLFFVFYALSFMPYLTVFQQNDDPVQNGFENFMDVCFLIDLIINFFTAIYSPKGE